MLTSSSQPEKMPEDKLHETALLIERSVAVALFVGLLAGVALILRPFVTAILFGTILVVATWPVRERLLRQGLSKGAASAILSSIAIACIAVPILLLAPRLTGWLTEGMQRAQALFAGAPEAPNWLAHMPLIGAKAQQLWAQLVHGEVQEVFRPYAPRLRKALFDLGSALADGMLQAVLSLAIAAMFWLRGDVFGKAAAEVAERLGGPLGGEALNIAAASVRGIAYGVVGTALLQAAALGIGLYIAGVPGSGLLAFLAFLIALSQIGILLVVIWGGAAWWLFNAGDQGLAIFMVAWGIFVSTIDNVIRPWLVSFGTPMPIMLVFLGVLGGFFAFGFLGMFIGPTLMALLFALLQAWRRPAKLSASPNLRADDDLSEL